MPRVNTRTAAALIALLVVFLLTGCPGNSPTVKDVTDANGNSSKPDMTKEKADSGASGSSYAAMSEEEQTNFVREKAITIIKELGTTREENLPDEAVAEIKKRVDIYSARARKPRKSVCSVEGFSQSDLRSVIERGADIAPEINSAFTNNGLLPQVGLYIAMIESEYCPCIQSSTGPLGMFQLTTATGRKFGLETNAGASTANPDDRCVPAKASVAEAKRVNAIIDRLVEESNKGSFGKESGRLEKNSAKTVLLAVAANNMGVDLFTQGVKDLGPDASTDIWSLIANKDKLPGPFPRETYKYVPAFIGAAIVGENPSSFGITNTKPLSTLK